MNFRCLALSIASLGLQACVFSQALEGLAELCAQPVYRVTSDRVTAEAGEVCSRVDGSCDDLRTAINSANLCRDHGPKTVELPPDAIFTIADIYSPPPYLQGDMRPHESAGAVGLPRILGELTIEGRDSTIERSSTGEIFRLLHVVPGASLTLRNLGLQGGVGTGAARSVFEPGTEIPPDSDIAGGGLLNGGSTSLSRVRFQSNTAPPHGSGGAVFNIGTLRASESLFIENEADAGSAIFNTGSLYLQRSRVERNLGNVIDNHNAAIISQSGFRNARGLRNARPGTMVVDGTTFSGGTALVIGVSSGRLIVRNSTIHGVRSGIYCGSGEIELADVTLIGDSSGWGIDDDGPCTWTIARVLIGNFSLNCQISRGFPPRVLAPSLSSDDSCLSFAFEGAVEVGPLTDNGGPTETALPLAGSPAIDGGGTACSLRDQRGFARPVDGDSNGSALCDIGAVEFGSRAP